MPEVKNILITGPPRCGKSTIIANFINSVDKPITGFFTREIRERGRRVGFSIITMDGEKGILAHQNIKTQPRVGKYGVHLRDIDDIAVPAMIPATLSEIVVIDEIGKMECFSEAFRHSLIKVLDSKNPVIGSIALKGNEFIENIKKREDITLIRVSDNNRDELVDLVINHYFNT